MKLNKSIIVVTGGASGIGKALVRQFSSEGANVIIADLNLESAVELAKEIGGFGVFCDVRIEKSIIDLVKVVTDKFYKIDISDNPFKLDFFIGIAQQSSLPK